jgi:glutamate/tyrosine decarboxylase-like PLP-dependent enzyme
MPVLTSGFVHASSKKALAMLGAGRAALRQYARDGAGRIDLAALERALRALRGAPAVLIANAGEVNAGEFDPIEAMADLAQRHGAWLHVDGAFGLFARLSPRTAALAAGVERADSVTADGHKWLNVPFDCGFAFVRDARLLAKTFAYAADYLPDPADPRPQFGNLGPESSRRSRALAVWATLRAYGRSGYRALVEHDLDLAQALRAQVDAAPDLQRLAEVPLNVVCFRFNPGGLGEPALDALNERLGAAVLADGRVYVGTTRYSGKVAFRPALVSWRTRAADVELLVRVVRELGALALREAARSGS